MGERVGPEEPAVKQREGMGDGAGRQQRFRRGTGPGQGAPPPEGYAGCAGLGASSGSQVREKTAGVSARPLAPPRVRTRPRGQCAEARAGARGPPSAGPSRRCTPAQPAALAPGPAVGGPPWGSDGRSFSPTPASPLVTRTLPSARSSASQRAGRNRLQGTRFQLRSSSRTKSAFVTRPGGRAFTCLTYSMPGTFTALFSLYSHTSDTFSL